jgi:GTPase-associated protein 1, N-terminal domain type 1
MASASIHQAIHGYRDGHKLLSSSTPLGSDAARAMLVLSDMSGPSMQTGFDEYITAYPLSGTDYFVFARTWYAPEMQRPGCVWTHSLLIPRARIADVSAARLIGSFRRPRPEGVETAATSPIAIVTDASLSSAGDDGFADRVLAAKVIGAVLGQPRPVILVADTAAQFEAVFLRLWEKILWPAERARFSFCTGALMPRSSAGVLLDLQAVPRSIPSSQFRKSASAALLLDLRAPGVPEPWVDLMLDGGGKGDATFRAWLEAAAGPDAGRAAVRSFAPIFGEWNAPGSSAGSALTSVLGVKDLEAGARNRLVGMVFDRANTESGAAGLRELLHLLCAHRVTDLSPMASMLEDQTKRLFEESRSEGVALVVSLLGSDLTEVGERVLRAAVLLLVPKDVVTFGDAQSPFLPTIVGVNPALAQSPILWQRVGRRAIDVLSELGGADLDEETRGSVVDAIFSSGRDFSVDAVVHFGGRVAILRALSALASGQLQLSWQWRTALSAQPNWVLEWLENLSSPSLRDLELGSRFVSPKAAQSRLLMVWRSGTASSGSIASRVAAFGLTLAFWEADVKSPLLAVCFQPTYDAAGSSRLEFEEWEWLKVQAPAVSWYRDWDRCERLAAALARLLQERKASLETVFGIIHSRPAIRKVAAVLDDEKDMRPYLKALRKAVESSSLGTLEQRAALLEDW